MKKLLGTLVVLCALCTALPVNAEPVYGFIYKDATEAGEGFSTAAASKCGTATCTSFFGIVGEGNCSVNAAAKNGNIRTVSYYDIHTKNILGYKKVTVRAYGN